MAKDPLLPIHLEGYDWLNALEQWRKRQGKEEFRYWNIEPNMKRDCVYTICCTITWVNTVTGDKKMIKRLGHSAELVVYKALTEYGRHRTEEVTTTT